MDVFPTSDEDLVEGINCTAPSITDFPADLFTDGQRRSGVIIIHILFDFYLFYALAIVCDEYFVPAVERIAKELKMPSDIAGCTVMGIANSSPELFTNVVGTFVTKGDMGIGTIVGASVFNILAVGAGIGLCVKNLVSVSWWSITRDSFFYLISIVSVAQALVDGYIRMYDAIILLVLYVIYIIVIYFNAPLKNLAKKLLKIRTKRYNVQKLMLNIAVPQIGILRNTSEKTLTSVTLSSTTSESDDAEKIPVCDSEEENMKICQRPSIEATPSMWIDFILGWPFRLLLKLTIPDCKTSTWAKWYFITFFMCVVWNTILCYLVSWITTIIGHTVGIPDTLMGLTVIAAGTSVPQIVGSIIVARKGLVTMAMNNAIGSNIFNVLICCGVPWLIRILIDSSNIKVHSNSLIYSSLMLILSIIVLYFLLAVNKFCFDRKIGFILLACYMLFIVVGSLFEMNVFFNINFPQCPIDLDS